MESNRGTHQKPNSGLYIRTCIKHSHTYTHTNNYPYFGVQFCFVIIELIQRNIKQTNAGMLCIYSRRKRKHASFGHSLFTLITHIFTGYCKMLFFTHYCSFIVFPSNSTQMLFKRNIVKLQPKIQEKGRRKRRGKIKLTISKGKKGKRKLLKQ